MKHFLGCKQPNETTTEEDESDWLHKNDRFQMQCMGGRMRPVNISRTASHGDTPVDAYIVIFMH